MPHLTVLHTQRAVEAIYENDDFEDFTLMCGFFDPKNDVTLGWKKAGDAGGGSAGLYKYNAGKNQYILAFRGSKGAKDCKVDDLQIGLSITVDRANDCINYTRQLRDIHKDAFILLAGHSLGGYLAQVVGATLDMPFISYNAPPAGSVYRNDPSLLGFKKGANLRVNWDPVSRAPGKHVGPLMTMPFAGTWPHLAHTNAEVEKSMARCVFKHNVAMAFITRNNR